VRPIGYHSGGLNDLRADSELTPIHTTTACPDTTGIVAAIAGFLAANNGLITEAQHHDDPYTRMSFMRTAFHDSGEGMPSLEVLDRTFAEEVGRRNEVAFPRG